MYFSEKKFGVSCTLNGMIIIIMDNITVKAA